MDRLHYFEPNDSSSRGVFLVIHGMNNHALMMDPLVDIVRGCGYVVARLTLTGHDCIPATKFDGSISRWLEDVDLAYRDIVRRYPQAKVSGLGFSLGGALLVASQDRNPNCNFEKLILLAPALCLRWYLRSLQWADLITRPRYSVPNFVPPAYRTYRFSPVTSYGSTSDAVRLVTKLQNPEKFKTAKMMLAMSAHDRLLDLGAIKKWIKRNRIETCKVLELNAKPEISRTLNHLVVDRPTLGKAEWSRLVENITEFVAPSQ